MASTSDLVIGGVADPAEIAARLWPVADLEREYAAFVNELATQRQSLPATPEEGVRVAFDTSARIERLLRRDPLLPPQVNPTSAARHARLQYRSLIEGLNKFDLVRKANIFNAYRQAMDHAVQLDEAAFNHWLHTQTAAPAAT